MRFSKIKRLAKDTQLYMTGLGLETKLTDSDLPPSFHLMPPRVDNIIK